MKYNRKIHSARPAGEEPFIWTMGGALVLGMVMIVGFLIFVLLNGIFTFYPKSVYKILLADSSVIAGEKCRHEIFQPDMKDLTADEKKRLKFVGSENKFVNRWLYKTGNYDLYNMDYVWVPDYKVNRILKPEEIYFVERMEWGPFIGFIQSFEINGIIKKFDAGSLKLLQKEHENALHRKKVIDNILKNRIAKINHKLEKLRLSLKEVIIKHGSDSSIYNRKLKKYKLDAAKLNSAYLKLQAEADLLRDKDAMYTVLMHDANGREKKIRMSDIVRFFPANSLNFFEKLGIYFSRWFEFLTQQPREANTEGGVMPAIFGTFAMTLLMVIIVAPFGVLAALYLREYAKQGHLVSIVRICVNNLAGVPSIVYGVFGLGFFAYIIGGSIDSLFFSERLPSPTFGTGGILWASLTLALLTVPVVIVATEEALAAVPSSLREASLACGASKWQTIKNIVLPKALPGIMTGVILAMARGAGEVAPLMLVGVVKLAPELPVDGYFPFVHLERSFMHLGFHIFDVGFQSRNSEAGKPMVFVTTLLLIALIALMNAIAIYIRNRLKRKYSAGHF